MNVRYQQNSAILGSGVFFPSQRVKSDDLFLEFHSERDYGIPTDWMSKSMGIIERRMCGPDTKPSDIAIPAARQALESCAVRRDQIDMVLFCGIERDQPEPATAHTIQSALGLNANVAYDLSNACYGFLDGVRSAVAHIQSGQCKYALVVTGEITSKLIPLLLEQLKEGMPIDQAKDKLGFLSVGDAGGAMIIGPAPENSQAGFRLFKGRTSSDQRDKCYYRYNPEGKLDCRMQMARIVARTTRLQRSIYQEGLEKAGWDQPDYLLVHQVGKKSFDEVIQMGLIEPDRMVKTYDTLGNITSATFPVSHHALINDQRLREGDRIYGCYSGSGIVVGQFAYIH